MKRLPLFLCSLVPLIPLLLAATHTVATTAELQLALGSARDGDAIAVQPGIYAPPANWPRTRPLFALQGRKMLTLSGPAELDAQGRVDTLLQLDACADCVIDGLTLRNSRRSALVLSACQRVIVVECAAFDCTTEPHLIAGQFRVAGGASDACVFEHCAAIGGVKGFELREVPTYTSAQATVPPVAGNVGYPNGLPESQWSGFFGYAAAPSNCRIVECVAIGNARNIQHSDGFSPRYSRACQLAGCIALFNGDDGADGIGSVDLDAHDNWSLCNGYAWAGAGVPPVPLVRTGGNGNGLKCGVRGGLRNAARRNVLLLNANGGLTFADCEQGLGELNMVFGSPVAISCEAARGHVPLLLDRNVVDRPTKLANGAKAHETGGVRFAPGAAQLDELTRLVQQLAAAPPRAGRVSAWHADFTTRVRGWLLANGVPPASPQAPGARP